MKLSAKLAALKKRNQTKRMQTQPGQRKGAKSTLWRWAWLALGLMVAGAATLAVLEFFIWNKVPPALVGTWKVQEGSKGGGTFEFSRNGTLLVHLKDPKNDFNLKARAVVQGKTLQTTTYNPQTLQEQTHTSTIVELTARSLILEFENGEVLKMVR